MKYSFLILFLFPFLVFGQLSQDQKQEIEEIKLKIAKANHDSIVIKEWINWDNIIYLMDPELDLELNQKIDSLCSLNIKKKLDEKSMNFFLRSKAFSLNNMGLVYYDRGKYSKAIQYHLESLEIDKAIDNQNGLANSYMNLGNNYYIQGHYSDAIEFYNNSLKIHEKLDNKSGMANALMNIGNINHLQKNYEKTIEYYNQSLALREEINDVYGIAGSLNNIGGVYWDQGNFEKATEFYLKCFDLRMEMGDQQGAASALGNLGSVNKAQGNYTVAMDYYGQSLKIKEELGDKLGITATLKSIAGLYLDKGDYSKARKYSQQALKIAQEIGVAIEIRDAARTYYLSSKASNDYATALEMYELYVATKDSLESEENQKAIIHQEFKYKYEKQAAADSVKAAEAGKVKDAEVMASKEESKRLKIQSDKEKQQNIFLFIGLGLAIIFGLFMYNRFKVTNSQKEIIIKQKLDSEKKSEIIAEQHREISDSINYAEMIQQSVLPTLRIEDINKNSFVLMLPKDKVSGDFYWLEESEKYQYYVVADCTGHGIPVAFISMIGTILINEIYNSKKMVYPNEILDELNRLIKLTLTNKEGETMKDGMDIAFVMVDKTTNEVFYSGANNPIWILSEKAIITNNNEEISPNIKEDKNNLFEIKADKQPIGKYADNPKVFTLNKIKLNKGDSFFIFSDGFADQFGGPKGKKFKQVQFKRILLDNSSSEFTSQREILKHAFMDWKSNLEQIDDVCIIGAKV